MAARSPERAYIAVEDDQEYESLLVKCEPKRGNRHASTVSPHVTPVYIEVDDSPSKEISHAGVPERFPEILTEGSCTQRLLQSLAVDNILPGKQQMMSDDCFLLTLSNPNVGAIGCCCLRRRSPTESSHFIV